MTWRVATTEATTGMATAMPTAAVLSIGRHRTGQRKGEKSDHSFHISIHSSETPLKGRAELETAEIRAHAQAHSTICAPMSAASQTHMCMSTRPSRSPADARLALRRC